MREILNRLAEGIAAARPLAYCRLVETRGSTPQKAGATMLVYPDGEQAGTLGGGCVEAEVKRRALAVLHSGEATVATFQLDHDYGWDDGLICGGRMRILIQPVLDDTARGYYLSMFRLAEQERGWTEAIVCEELPGLRSPASFLVDESGELVAALPKLADEVMPEAVSEHLLDVSSRPRPYVRAGISYLPISRRCRLIIVGGGHVGKAVAELAVDLSFDVWVVDDRSTYVAESRFPRVERRICGDIDQTLADLDVTPDTYCLIVTRGHQHDQRALYHLAERGARYVGMIGSKRKIKLIFENLRDEGISAEALNRVFAPLGIDIGSQTVPEIAVSICAELIAHRNKNGQVPGRPNLSLLPTVPGT